MGTRHLICVVKDGDYKVAQYGQWDGYPSGQGVDILNFLASMDRKLFESKVDLLSWITDDELQEQWRECGANDNSGFVTMEVADKHNLLYPENSRDTGAKLLGIIQDADRPIKLVNQVKFAGDSLFCEWAYVIDLDKNVLEVYEGFNKEPHQGERFSDFERDKEDSEYYPVKLAQTFDLNNLPSVEDFLSILEPNEEE